MCGGGNVEHSASDDGWCLCTVMDVCVLIVYLLEWYMLNDDGLMSNSLHSI